MAIMRVSVHGLRDHVAVGQQENDGVIPLDRPRETGGTGMGFNGGHLMLLGWGACFKSTLVAAAQARGLKVDQLELAISGETAESPYRFVSVDMKVRLEGDLERSDLEKLVTIARNGCAVSNTLKNAVEMTVELA